MQLPLVAMVLREASALMRISSIVIIITHLLYYIHSRMRNIVSVTPCPLSEVIPYCFAPAGAWPLNGK